MSEDLQLLLKDEQAAHSQTPREQKFFESDKSINLETMPETVIKREIPVDGPEEYKLACALTTLTLEVFEIIDWEYWKNSYCESPPIFNSFRDEVFEALAYFAWNLYDKEDLENIAFIDDIYDECKSIWKLVCSDKENSELDLSVLDLDVNKYKKVREQDLCNLLWWSCQNPPRGNEKKEFERFESCAQLYLNKLEYHDHRDFEKYVEKARNIMRDPDNLDPKGMPKKQLRMEMDERKCYCVLDALFMQSWKRINLQVLEGVITSKWMFEGIVQGVYGFLYRMSSKRIMRLHQCQKLVTYPLSNKKYGSWDDEVVKVIKLADLKRRSEERRFIGTDHILFYLHQMLLSETPYKLEQSERSKDLRCDIEEKHSDTIYHLYKKAYKIATKLGDKIIRLEHLYAAITTGDDDDKSSWKLSVECARMTKVYRKETSKVEDEPHTNPWTEVFADSWNENIATVISERQIDRDDVLPAVKRMKDEDNTPLQNAIYNLLNKVDEHKEMTEGEILKLLKRNVMIMLQYPPKVMLHKETHFVNRFSLTWTREVNCSMMAMEPINPGLKLLKYLL